MPSLVERATARLSALRERRPAVEHVIRTFLHYSDRNGNAQAGAVTFFGFLSFFPVLALSFFAVGYVSEVYPEARHDLVVLLEDLLPGLIGVGEGQLSLREFEASASTVGWLGLLGLVYSGLGWVSGMRRALEVMFRLPKKEQPNFVVGKAWDLVTLPVLGSILLLSVTISGSVTWLSGLILDWVDLDKTWLATVVLAVLGYGLAILATTVFFLVLFRMLAHPRVASRALWQGAFAGAVGFELLKAGAGLLFGLTRGQPAFQAFGVALILVVWINYFSRLVMLSAAWAYTAPAARRLRELERTPLLDEEDAQLAAPAPAAVAPEDPETDRA